MDLRGMSKQGQEESKQGQEGKQITLMSKQGQE